MDELLCQLMLVQLQSIGLFTEKISDVAGLKAKAGLHNWYGRWLEETIEVLTRNNYLKSNGISCILLNTVPIDANETWKEWDLKKGAWLESSAKAQTILLEVTLRALPEILTGKVRATDIMFPNSSMELVEGVYKHNPVADYFNRVLSNVIIMFIKERLQQDPSAQIKILEIGAGTGGTSAMLFRKLNPYKEHIQEYCYTDISKAFLLHAEKEYGPHNSYLTYKIYNVEASAAEQGINTGWYDMVIATNVLHATKNIRQTLRNAKTVLRNNGLILLNEILCSSLFTHLTFGLLEGWWLYEDATLRIPGCPGLSSKTWKAVLESEGFRSVFFPAQEAHDLGQQIVVAESDGVVRQKQGRRISVVSTEQKTDNTKTLKVELPKKAFYAAKMGGITDELLCEKSTMYFKKVIGKTLRISENKIDSSTPLEEYGIDSILVVQLTNILRGVFEEGSVTSTLFFEYQTIDALVEHFVKTQRGSLISLLGLEEQDNYKKIVGDAEVVAAVLPAEPEILPKNPRRFLQFLTPESKAPDSQALIEPIAIIGISGRYPKAKNLEEYWINLKSGKKCITEIPGDRWPLEGFFHPDPQEAVTLGKSYSRWGGFLDGFADFDPLFFKISPREAVNMDPQERLFIRSCWEVFEDAGYAREQLMKLYNGQIGVFVGITKTGYELYGPELWKQGEQIYPHTSFSSLANRVSYLFNLHGPSIPIDTMCSSSLTAIHEACERIRHGECEMAVAGGVNLYLHPLTYVSLCRQQLLSKNDMCAAFGQGGDGFVPGEGVGCVLLKPLSRAKKDGDHIYAVILGSHINHGGKTNGYMVPNPNAQCNLIVENFKNCGVDPRTISYVESAANGSNLGDPIEVSSLSKAFSQFTEDKYFCAIGSVKPNIGHLEAASGISQLTKVILQLQHKLLVPTIHAQPLNPNLSFQDTPFHLQLEAQEWKRPIAKINGEEREFPRRATVSSFGAGGANAHLIVEEYIPEHEKTIYNCTIALPQIVVFSAKGQNQLRRVVQQMLEFLRLNPELSLQDIAYTLQVGREAMTCRLAMIVSNKRELIDGLKEYLNSRQEDKVSFISIYTGDVSEEHSEIKKVFSGINGEAMLKLLLNEKQLEKIALIWVQGGTIPWELLHKEGEVCKISLPMYPFEEQRYWIDSKVRNNKLNPSIETTVQYFGESAVAHPISTGSQGTPDNKCKFTWELSEILHQFQDKKSNMESTDRRINKVLSYKSTSKGIADKIQQETISNILKNLECTLINVEQAVDCLLEYFQKQNDLKLNILIKEMLCILLDLKMEEVSINTPLLDYGADSIVLMDFYHNLVKHFSFLDIDTVKHSSTLNDIIIQIEEQADNETLNSIVLKKGLEERYFNKSVINIVNTKNISNIILRENEIEEQRQRILGQLVKISQTELNKRNLIKEDIQVPAFRTFDLLIDDRNCIWVFFKVKVFGEQEIIDMTDLENIIKNNFHMEKIPIIYFTHYGPHFLLGGDRLFFAESNINEQENVRFQKWLENFKLMFFSNIPEEYPLRVAVCAGTAQGGGFEYLITCDFQFVLPQIKLGVPEIKSSLYAGMGGLSYLSSQLGLARTKLLNLTGGLIYGHQAYQFGLLSHLSINPFDDAYNFYYKIPNINIAKHLNYRLNEMYKELKGRDLSDWIQHAQSNVKGGYEHILDDYKMFI